MACLGKPLPGPCLGSSALSHSEEPCPFCEEGRESLSLELEVLWFLIFSGLYTFIFSFTIKSEFLLMYTID